MTEEFLKFTRDILVPCANANLRQKYDAYCAGEDIGIETKSDDTPASRADRETELALRALITKHYPDHGILGEEYGAENIDRDWVWVLDPLDGTKEFLAKNPGCFGTLIGLLYQGKTMLGAVSDPINEKLWMSEEKPSLNNTKRLKDSTITCTNPDAMFTTQAEKEKIQAVQNSAKAFKTRMDCMGFARILDGTIDAAVENDLNAHDILPLIPVLKSSGVTLIDFEGKDYAPMTFDLEKAATQKYGVIAAANPALAQDILSIFQKETP